MPSPHRRKTTIQPALEAHSLAQRVANFSGLSLSDVFTAGMLMLAAQHARALAYSPGQRELCIQICDSVIAEVEKIRSTAQSG